MPSFLNVFSHKYLNFRLQGRNLFGKVGLFPQSYTTSDPSVVQGQPAPQAQANGLDVPAAVSAAPSSLQTLNEEAEDISASATPDTKKKEEGQAVMRATMTDVQEAIEQLGRSDRDGNGSFSFASTHETDTDRDTDTEAGSNAGEAWHKGARSNLAEKARQQQELLRKEQEAYDAELQLHAPVLAEHISEPPIEFEMSDESEDEEEEEHSEPAAGTRFPRRDHEHISEEEEDDEASVRQKPNGHPITPRAGSQFSDLSPPSRNLTNPWESVDAEPETAKQISFPTATPAESGAPAQVATEVPHPESSTENIQVRSSYMLYFLLLTLHLS